MSADLYLHVVPDLAVAREAIERQHRGEWITMDDAHRLDQNWLMKNLYCAPQVWVGQVSWLKADLFGDDDAYVPRSVAAVQQLWEEPRPVDPHATKLTMDAMNLPNLSIYGRPERLYDREHVDANWSGGRRVRLGTGQRMVIAKTRGLQRPRVIKRFLQAHTGKVALAVSQ